MSPTSKARSLALLIAPAIAASVLAAAPREARAGLTLQASAGFSYVFGGERGPLTFEVGPGWDFKLLRVEVPLVIGAASNDLTFPPRANGVLGARPSLKLFPLDPFYGKVAIHILSAGGTTYGGLSLGGGVEFKLLEVVGVFGELDVDPYLGHSGQGNVPVELRAGITLLF